MKKNNKVLKWIVVIFWVFLIGSVFGFFAEMIYGTVYSRALVIRRGLIYGPFVQVYGFGAIAYYILLTKVKEPKDAFLAGMIMGSVLEYLCSFFQEIFFGTISWDYSRSFFNLNGRTSLQYAVYWGIIAVVFLKLIYPELEKLKPYLKRTWVKVLTVVLMVYMTFDITVSCMAGARQNERRKNIPPKNSIDVLIDEIYPDERLDKIYNNKIEM